jgi:hypothetical protein
VIAATRNVLSDAVNDVAVLMKRLYFSLTLSLCIIAYAPSSNKHDYSKKLIFRLEQTHTTFSVNEFSFLFGTESRVQIVFKGDPKSEYKLGSIAIFIEIAFVFP